MAIKKQEFYEGAALHLIARSGLVTSIRYQQPFFLLNECITALLKYSTRGRSPWGFTFTDDEQRQLLAMSSRFPIVIGLVCGSDGVAAISYESYLSVAPQMKSTVHIACYRDHGEHYEITGPDGPLKRRVAPSAWQKILES